MPSGQAPFRQRGPASLNSAGATPLHSLSISIASSLISHCALLQHLWLKKLCRERTFIVTTIEVVQAFGRIKRASSFAFFIKAEHCFLLISLYALIISSCVPESRLPSSDSFMLLPQNTPCSAVLWHCCTPARPVDILKLPAV